MPLQGHGEEKATGRRHLPLRKKALSFAALQNRNQTVKGIAGAIGVGEVTVYLYQKELKEQGEISWAE